ncbi:transketolase C-terminal domain-containing protein [Bdellovibrionales bacterium]|nr:transketolase C-terminal domain-containing protein [Bdellovibrionales bacterium]
MSRKEVTYCDAMREGFYYLMEKYDDVFTIGQGLWSPWYVGNSMKDLDKVFGKERVIDSPVSEAATTGIAVGAAVCGKRPIVIHPRMDFMVLATDPIVNQAAKWSHMFGGQATAGVTVRGIINRGGQQGAQHSQSLHSWYAHVPGLRVVMPATASDARDLLISSVLCDDPVLYIDDKWLYDWSEELGSVEEAPLEGIKPQILKKGKDITIVASGYSSRQAFDAANELEQLGISAEVIDLRVINPIDYSVVYNSVEKTGRLCAVDGGWSNCGLAGEIISSVCEKLSPNTFKSKPKRITLTNSPAPTSGPLEERYYTKNIDIINLVKEMVENA